MEFIPANRDLVDHVSDPIAKILNQSLKDEKLPADWKSEAVSLIFKQGDTTVAANIDHLQTHGIIYQRSSFSIVLTNASISWPVREWLIRYLLRLCKIAIPLLKGLRRSFISHILR